jgi:hypothetical protein
MKPSSTDKCLAALLFTLTVIHTTSHFNAQAQTESQMQVTPCSTEDQSVGKQLEIYGQIVQIELGEEAAPDSANHSSTGNVRIALHTGADCQIEALVDHQEWQSWSSTQQELLTIGSLVEIGGHISAADGHVVLQVDQPPDLH